MIHLKKIYMFVALTIVSLTSIAYCASLLLIGDNVFPKLYDKFVKLWSEEFGK